jgi:hypothetical protein
VGTLGRIHLLQLLRGRLGLPLALSSLSRCCIAVRFAVRFPNFLARLLLLGSLLVLKVFVPRSRAGRATFVVEIKWSGALPLNDIICTRGVS